MNWIEVSLHADGEAVEVIADLLQQYGYQGVVFEQLGIEVEAWEDELPPAKDMIIRAYLPADDQAPALKAKLEDGLGYLAQIYPAVPRTPTYTAVADENWAEAWKAHYKPLRVGEHIFIRPAWTEVEPKAGDVEIILDPGVAFGTGTHPSTQLCLIGLEAQPCPLPDRVLDLGCGSGILAITAAKFGAGHIWALDTDPLAVKSSGENAELNSVRDKLTIEQGTLDGLLASGQAFGLILVNILAKTIIPMCEQGLGRIVEPGGVGLFSGIIEEQADDVEAALRATGLMPVKRWMINDWVGIEARREA